MSNPFAWSYYSVELKPGVVAPGIYPDTLPMLPRMLLRGVNVAGMECLDVGTMEGLIPVLLAKQKAARVVATDADTHCAEKLAMVKHLHGVEFEHVTQRHAYDMQAQFPTGGFDLINLSGLLYHVVSPLMVLQGIRPLLKRNALMIVSTNVTTQPGYSAEFNAKGRLQQEPNTFWYPTVQLLDYWFQMLNLTPIECLFMPHTAVQAPGYLFEKRSGYVSVLVQACDTTAAFDPWMGRACSTSWEMTRLTDWERVRTQPESKITHSYQPLSTSLHIAVNNYAPITTAKDHHDSHLLLLGDAH